MLSDEPPNDDGGSGVVLSRGSGEGGPLRGISGVDSPLGLLPKDAAHPGNVNGLSKEKPP